MMSSQDLFSDIPLVDETVRFEPTRRAGIARLEQFATRTGSHYASRRNFDMGPSDRSTVSALSPWIRHRLVTEQEVLTQALARNSAAAASKFIQEVFWRGYFKGWLEQHPSVWESYQSGLQAAKNRLDRDASLKAIFTNAIEGRTGIACFDHWCCELKETGYLHNRVRMWFASIWIFTLRLPWELGAAFFLHHLIDGDPAPNTLSWRWVGGLHTKGKTYLARPDNIARFTNGAFEPIGQLATIAEPLLEESLHTQVPLAPRRPLPQSDYLLLVTPEDCRTEDFLAARAAGVLGLCLPPEPGQTAQSYAFTQGAVADALLRHGAPSSVVTTDDWAKEIITTAQRAGTNHVVTSFAPVGPTATKLASVKPRLAAAGIELCQQRRLYDTVTWPHATRGFFKLKGMIPSILKDLGFSHVESA